uniref:Uncharacterized protein n=1 Tax=Anguilla anguilla TaxID=7936 RepID=A0A0E9VLB1_ANGAN
MVLTLHLLRGVGRQNVMWSIRQTARVELTAVFPPVFFSSPE